MKSLLIQSIRLTSVFAVLLMVIYPAIIWSVSQISSNHGKGFKYKNHYENIGQKFDKDDYFYSRPSAVDYNAAGSCGSNKGTSNPEYLATVQARIDTFLVHNPDVKKSQIPSELVTASGSGLDPNISVQGAKIQVNRIAKIRGIDKNELFKLISKNTEKPFLGLFGPEKINVLKLNIALDNLK